MPGYDSSGLLGQKPVKGGPEGDPWWGPHEKPSHPLTDYWLVGCFTVSGALKLYSTKLVGKSWERERCERLKDTIAPFRHGPWLFVAALRNCRERAHWAILPRRKGPTTTYEKTLHE